MFECREIAEAIYKEGAPSKITSRQNPTVTVLAEHKREEELPRHPTMRRAVLESARKSMQDIRAMHRTMQKIQTC